MGLRKPRTIITGIIIMGIMAVSGPTGIIIALTGRAEVTTRSQLVEYHFAAFGSGDLARPILFGFSSDCRRFRVLIVLLFAGYLKRFR